MASDPQSTIVKDLADNILTFLYLCAEDGRHRLSVPLKNMDGAVPIAFGAAPRSATRHDLIVLPNDGAPALWPVDARVVFSADRGRHADTDFWPLGTLQFGRMRSITTAEARRLGATRFSPRMVMDEMVVAKPDGEAVSAKVPAALMGGIWQNAAPGTINAREVSEVIPAALGFALALRYEWTVWIGLGDGPRIRFLSDPLGAREVFRLRDLPPGRERRAALRHWVSAHTRAKRDDQDARAWVRRHMRGATDFDWNGMRCRIQPADFDVEQVAEGVA
jgi:hypothetical protein